MIYCRTLCYARHILLRHPEVDRSDIDRCVIDKLDDECVVALARYMSDKKKERYVHGKLARGEWSTI